MNKLKMLFVMTTAIFSFSQVDAQTTKKKGKMKKETAAMHYQCPMKCEGEKTYHKNGKCPVCNMQMKPVKVLVATAAYQCIMKCEGDKTYAKAGKCPVCQMDLRRLETTRAKDGHESHNHN
jgi:transcription initiation factor IIE alpha subunit